MTLNPENDTPEKPLVQVAAAEGLAHNARQQRLPKVAKARAKAAPAKAKGKPAPTSRKSLKTKGIGGEGVEVEPGSKNPDALPHPQFFPKSPSGAPSEGPWSQDELAAALGMHVSLLSRWVLLPEPVPADLLPAVEAQLSLAPGSLLTALRGAPAPYLEGVVVVPRIINPRLVYVKTAEGTALARCKPGSVKLGQRVLLRRGSASLEVARAIK